MTVSHVSQIILNERIDVVEILFKTPGFVSSMTFVKKLGLALKYFREF